LLFLFAARHWPSLSARLAHAQFQPRIMSESSVHGTFRLLY
jgi:hypothetical protein